MHSIYVTAPFTDPNGETHEPDTVVDVDAGVSSHARFYGVGRLATAEEAKDAEAINKAAEDKRLERAKAAEEQADDDGEQPSDTAAAGDQSTKSKSTSRRAGSKGEESA